jgi:MFS family permease
VSRDGFAALRIPAVRRYILGRIAWAMGSQMLAVSVGWQIYDRTRSMLALGLVGLVQVVPVVLLALPAGHFVDRHNRRDVAILGTGLTSACVGALYLISRTGAPIELMYAVLFVMGVATSFTAPAVSSLMAQITPKQLFVNANAWRSTTFQLAASIGPALGGLTIAWSGDATMAYAVALASVLSFLVVLGTLPRPPTPLVRHDAARDELRAGLRFVFGTELMLAAITLDLFAVLLGGATALLPVFARDRLGVGPEGLGWLRAAPSLGALAMALVTTRLPPWRHTGRALLVSVAGFGAATIVFGLSRDFALSFVALFVAGVFDNVSVVIRLTLEQLITPDQLRGRVSAVHHVFIGLSNEMGEFESGVTAALVGPVASVVGGGVGTLLVVLLVATKWPALRRLGRLEEITPAPPR